MWDAKNEDLPVIPTIASQFADAGVDLLWQKLAGLLNQEHGQSFDAAEARLGADGLPHRSAPIPPERQGYLAEVAASVRDYHARTEETSRNVRLVQQLEAAAQQMRKSNRLTSAADLTAEAEEIRKRVPDSAWQMLKEFDERAAAYRSGNASYTVREKEIPVETTTETLSGLDLPRVALPDTEDWGEKMEWIRSENVPGTFPFTAGVFPFKREDEIPLRMFAGEGSAERTNKRFHFPVSYTHLTLPTKA